MSVQENAPETAGLETERLILAAPQKTDVPAIVELANDTRIAENLASLPYPYTAADAREWIDLPRDRPAQVRFAIYLKDPARKFIGAAGIGRRDGGTTEIGYWIGQPYWERGYATEAARALVDYTFERTDLGEIWARCRVTNEASRRVIIRCGFQYDGSGTAPSRFFGGEVPVDRFRLTKPVWAELKCWRSPVLLDEVA